MAPMAIDASKTTDDFYVIPIISKASSFCTRIQASKPLQVSHQRSCIYPSIYIKKQTFNSSLIFLEYLFHQKNPKNFPQSRPPRHDDGTWVDPNSVAAVRCARSCRRRLGPGCFLWGYHLVMTIAMENHHAIRGKPR